MVPAHFHYVTDNKMKPNLVKNTAGSLLYQFTSENNLILVVGHILTNRESSCGFGHVQNFY